MELFMPTHVYSAKECVKKYGEIFRQYGESALIITGKHSSKMNGSLQAVTDQLEAANIQYTVFDAVEENPSIETVMKAAALGKEIRAAFVIGIGGGSPMDAAKAIAMMIANPDLGSEVFFRDIPLSYVPVIEVPTTAGTGSEVTPWSILTIHEKRTKSSIPHKIYPAAALVDSEYLKSASEKVLLSTAIDTLCHLVESHLVTKATDYSRIYTQAGLALWGSFKEALAEGQLTDSDYEKMMQASTLGGMAITHTGTGLPHALSYKITYETGLAHGFACGVTLAGFVEHYENEALKQQVLSLLGFSDAFELKQMLGKMIGKITYADSLWKENVEALMANPDKLATYPGILTKETVVNYLG